MGRRDGEKGRVKGGGRATERAGGAWGKYFT